MGYGDKRTQERVSNLGRTVGKDRSLTAFSGEQAAPLGMSSATGAESESHGWHLLCATHGVPMECAECDGDMLQQYGSPALSRMAVRRRVCNAVEARTGDLRRGQRDRLELAGDGRRDEQSAVGGKKELVPTPPIARKPARNVVF